MPAIPKNSRLPAGSARRPPVPVAPLAPTPEDQGRFNAEVESVARRVSESPLLNGRLLDVGELETGANNRTEHGLGRVPQGWIVVGVTGDANIWEGAAPDREALNLRTDNASAHWTLWVF